MSNPICEIFPDDPSCAVAPEPEPVEEPVVEEEEEVVEEEEEVVEEMEGEE